MKQVGEAGKSDKPDKQDQQGGSVPPEQRLVGALAKACILVIEDNEDLRYLLTDLLQRVTRVCAWPVWSRALTSSCSM